MSTICRIWLFGFLFMLASFLAPALEAQERRHGTVVTVGTAPTQPAISTNDGFKSGFTFEVGALLTNVHHTTHVGDIVRLHSIWVDPAKGSLSDFSYGGTYKPIETNPRNTVSPYGEVGYRFDNGWGVHGRFWSVRSSDKVHGVVNQPTAGRGESYIYDVRMWEHTKRKLPDQRTLSGVSPIRYDAAVVLNASVLDVLVSRRIGRHGRFELLAGGRWLRLNEDRIEGQQQEAFIYSSSFFGYRYHLHNVIDLRYTGSSRNQNFIGGVGGVRGRVPLFGKFSAEFSATQAVVTGNTREELLWHDVDDVRAVKGPFGGPFEDGGIHVLYEGKYHFNRRARVIIPVTDLSAKLVYEATPRVSVGINTTASAWFGVPLAPEWRMPGEWTGLGGTGPVLRRGNIAFFGIAAFLRFRK